MNFVYNSCGCGSWSNENAMKVSIWHKHRLETGRDGFTQEELDSCICNEMPGSTD